MDKTRVASQERPGWVLRKPYAPAYGFIKHTSFAPTSSSEGEQPACFRCTQPDLFPILLSQFWECFRFRSASSDWRERSAGLSNAGI